MVSPFYLIENVEKQIYKIDCFCASSVYVNRYETF